MMEPERITLLSFYVSNKSIGFEGTPEVDYTPDQLFQLMGVMQICIRQIQDKILSSLIEQDGE